jgi:hypothetical protein
MWVGVLIALVLVLGIVVMLVRKRVFSDEEREADGAGLVTSLRAARNRGDISQEEYEHTLRRIRGRLTGEPLPPPAREPRQGVDPGVDPEQERRAPPGVDLAGDPLQPSQD